MASGMFASSPTPPPVQAARAGGSAASGYDQFVEQQLRKTRTQVKLVDIVRNSLVLICGALAYMLAVALVDHWLVTLSFAARMAALAILVAGCGGWLYARIMPLVVRRINPVFAAYTIERAEPSLKNSLINFLLLRGDRSKVHDVVYQALGQRAASDLSHLPAETVVDYTPLIRIGYVLAALVAFGAAYKILSPKDPVQSVARVMAPWADIARASRVTIDDVRPGEAKIFQGDHVEVSAVLRGIRASDQVRVIFSTVDGQVHDQEVAMQPDSAGLRHIAKIPADEMGAQNSLHYKLVAGDAETKWYNVDVAPAPHVLVTKVLYEPPAYTSLPTEESPQGDISGLEGTKVTIFARANREIKSAYLEFDPIIDGASPATGSTSDARSLRITQIDGQELQVSFQLRLSDKRDAAWHEHYTLRYTSQEGHRNARPIIHTISVKPDLAPLAEILLPSEQEKTVPQNRPVEIEAKGIDLDFALSRLRLVAVSGGRDVLDVPLFESLEGQSGQVLKKLEFTPSHYALAVGDVVEYWAVAEDNRTSPRSGKPEPNITSSTPTYRLIIGPPAVERAKPEDEEQPEEDERAEGEDSESSSGGAPQGTSSDQGGSDSQQSDNSREPTARDGGGESGESGESGNSGGAEENSESGSDSSEEGSQSGNSRSANGQRDAEESESEGESDGSESSQNGASGSSNSSSSKPSGSQSGEASDRGTESSSEQSESSAAENSEGNSRSANGQRESNASDSSEPLASDGSQDGDAFEKIEQHREQQDSQQGGSATSADHSNDDSRSANGDRHPRGTGDSAQSPQNSGQENPSNSAGNSGNPQGNKPNDNQSGGEQGGSQQNQDQGEKPGGQQGGEQGNQSGGQQQGDKSEQGQGGNKNNQGGQNDQGQNKNAAGSQQGGEPQGGAKPAGDKPSNSSGGQKEQNSSGGQGQNDKSGAGQESQQGGGSPQSQAEKPEQKNGGEQSGGQQGGGQKKEEGGKSPSGSNKNSNSQGESGGDRSGGGEQGGGQGAKKPGNDSAGSSSAGDQGDGAANQPGAGESGNRGGGDQVADSPTGRSGEQTGEGSSSGAADEQGDRPRPQSGNEQGGDSSSSGNQPGGNRPKEGEQSEGTGEQISDTPGGGRGTLPTGGGKPADNHPSDTPLPDIEPGADAANLDYARKSTDLTLEYLKHQQENPDRELLDKLGWTKDDLAQFIERWDRMQRDAKTDDSGAAQRKLDDSLRSLGLRPRTSEVRAGDAGGTRLNNQREAGARTRSPKSYAEQYRAFSKFITPAKE